MGEGVAFLISAMNSAMISRYLPFPLVLHVGGGYKGGEDAEGDRE